MRDILQCNQNRRGLAHAAAGQASLQNEPPHSSPSLAPTRLNAASAKSRSSRVWAAES